MVACLGKPAACRGMPTVCLGMPAACIGMPADSRSRLVRLGRAQYTRAYASYAVLQPAREYRAAKLRELATGTLIF
jgi:hypothetical protein